MGKDRKHDSGDGWEYDIAPDQMPNLDISGNEGLPDMSFGMGGNTFVLKEGKNSTYLLLKFGCSQLPFCKSYGYGQLSSESLEYDKRSSGADVFVWGESGQKIFRKYCQDKACGAFKGVYSGIVGQL